MNLSNLLLLAEAISGYKMLCFETPKWTLAPEVGKKATYNNFLKVGTNSFDSFGKGSEQEQLSVLATSGEQSAAIAPAFLPVSLILASEVLCDWKKRNTMITFFVCLLY